MSSVFFFQPVQTAEENVPFLPLAKTLRNGKIAIFDFLDRSNPKDTMALYELMKDVAENDPSYPHDSMDTFEEFEAYFCSHDVIVAKIPEDDDCDEWKVVGGFYIKPNFPGRSSHICNAGFIVDRNERRLGICTMMAKLFIHVAKAIGYESSLFNIVYETSPGRSVYEKLGFRRIGTIPRAGKSEKGSYEDAHLYYFDFMNWDLPEILEDIYLHT